MAYHIIERNENENAIITNSRLTDVHPISILIDDPNGPKPGYDPTELSMGDYFYRYISQEEYEAIKRYAHITEEDIKADTVKTLFLPAENRWRHEDNFKRFYFTEEFFQTKQEAYEGLKLPEKPDYRMQFRLLQNVSVAYIGTVNVIYVPKKKEIKEIYIESQYNPKGIKVSVRSNVSFKPLT